MTRRHIAPFLWQRGIRHIDAVILSHADLDHFNGLPALVERFRIGEVICTPTFAERDTPAVAHTLRVVEGVDLPVRVVSRGGAWQVDGVDFRVLHPPAVGPAGSENARSLVLQVTSGDLHTLLTGDLESPGLEQVLALPAPPVDVLLAPHHGSERSAPDRLADWAAPGVVVSSQASPRFASRTAEHFERRGATFLPTYAHGTVTVRQRDERAWVETFRTGLRRPLHGNE